MANLSNFKAPFHNPCSIWEIADKFYDQYGKNIIPVDIEDIIEFDLKIEIFPKQNLYSDCDSNAFLATNCKTIYVDFDHYFIPKNLTYVRFSLAHEIGHLIIHNDIIPIIRPNDISSWKNTVLTIPHQEYKYIEWHAYEFAGRLLVPPDSLARELVVQKKNVETIYDSFPHILDDDVINKVAIPISKKFNVSPDVISKRIKIENVWELVKPKTNEV